MFYSTHMLGRKGPLAVIWIAAHKDPKFLKRAFVDTTSINAACETIMFPEAPLALRLSGQLVLGVVRVYYRQLEFLDDDAAAAYTKLLKAEKTGSRADQTTTRPEAHTAAASTIDLPATSNLAELDFEFVSHGLDHLLEDITPGSTPRKGGLQLQRRRSSFLMMHEDSQHSGMLPYLNSSQNLGEIDRFEKAADGFEPDALDFANFSRTFDSDTPEVARAAPADEAELRRADVAADLAAATPMSIGDGGTNGGKDPEALAPPPDEGPTLEHVPTPAAVTPPSTARRPRRSPATLPAVEIEPEPADPADEQRPHVPSSKARNAACEARRRRMRAATDVTADGNPAIQLPRSGIQALLKDRAPLIRDRGADVHKRLKLAPPPHAVVLQSSAADSNPLFGMASFDALAPQMYAQVRMAMGPVKQTDMPPPPPRQPGIRGNRAPSEAAQQPDAADIVADAAVPMDPIDDGMGATPMDVGGFDGGSATPMPMTGTEPDPIEGDGAAAEPTGKSLQGGSRHGSLQLNGRQNSDAAGGTESEDTTGQADGDKARVASWIHDELRIGGADSLTVLGKGRGVMKGRGRLFQARGFYTALALQAQDSAPIAISQERPLGDITIKRGVGYDSWQPTTIVRASG